MHIRHFIFIGSYGYTQRMDVIQFLLRLFFCFPMGHGFLVPATIESGCVIIDGEIVSQSSASSGSYPGFRMLLHTYSPLTWIVRGESEFPDQNTLLIRTYTFLQSTRPVHWTTIFTVNAKPRKCVLIEDLKDNQNKSIDLFHGDFDNHRVSLLYHFYADQQVILRNSARESTALTVELAVIQAFQLKLIQPDYVRLLQPFNGVIGAMPVAMIPDNTFLCVLGANGHDQILAIDLKEQGISTVGFGSHVYPNAEWPMVQLPVEFHYGGSLWNQHWTFIVASTRIYFNEASSSVLKTFGESEALIDTTSEEIQVPPNLFKPIFRRKNITEETKKIIFEFTYFRDPKPCDQVLMFMPSLTFTFRTPGYHQEITVSFDRSELVKHNQNMCRCLLREQIVKNNFWQFGLTFLYKVYTELLLINNRPVVKLFKRML